MGCFEPSCHFLDITQHSIGSDSNGQGIEEMIQPSGEKNLSVGGGSIFFVLKQNIMKHIMKYQYSEYKFHFPIVFLKAAGSSSVQCRLPSQSHCECHSTLVYASLPITSHLHSQAAASCDIILALGFATQTQWLSPQGGERPVACWAAVLIQTDFRVNAPAQEMQLPLDTLGLTLSQNIQLVSIYMAFIFARVGSCWVSVAR